MSSLDLRISKLETRNGSGKAWLITHAGRRIVVSDRHLNAIHPCWRRMAVPWDGRAPSDDPKEIIKVLQAGRLAALEKIDGEP